MPLYVKADPQVLYAISKSLNETEEAIGRAIGEAVAYNLSAMQGALPEEIKGKVLVEVASAGRNQVRISYKPRSGLGREFPLSKTNTAIFVEASKLRGYAGKTVFTKEGDEGIFLSKINQVGKAGIGAYALLKVQMLEPRITQQTKEVLVEATLQEMRNIFAEHGVKMVGGRYRAPAGGFTSPITGKFYGGGQTISGAF